MELHALRCFVAVAERLSFSRAAEELQTSQPALSRQIQALEQTLRVRLFDRVGRRVELTPAGAELSARARLLLQDAESFRSRAEDLSGGPTGLLRVGATPQTLESLVAPLLSRFPALWPGVDFQLVEDGAASLLDQVERGVVHVAIAALPGGSALRGRELFPLGVLAVVPPAHALARRPRIEVAELPGERLLLLRKAPPVHLGARQLGVWMSAIWNPRRYLSPAAGALIEEARRFTRRQYPGKSFHLGDLFDSSVASGG